MKTYIAILRGINVSGQKMIKMSELKKVFEELSFTNVKTYIQSGNIIFDAEMQNDQVLQQLIYDAVLKTFSFTVPIIILENKELKVIQEQNPFLSSRSEEITKLHVTFLDTIPKKELIGQLKEKAQFLSGEWIIDGKTIYLFCPDGYGKTKLSNNFFENKLKVTATTRNWKTVNELVSMSEL
jgi:uncharacterized protein (DUF1697 family)